MNQIIKKLIQRGIRFDTSKNEIKIHLGSATLSEQEKTTLRENKQAILDYLKSKKIACLSYPQERLWFLVQLGHSFQYHIAGWGRIKGNLNIEALQKTFDYIVGRHESLRTTFETIDGAPIQTVREHGETPIEQQDLSGLTGDEQSEKEKTDFRLFAQRAFDLEHGPLLRVLLIKLTPHTHTLCLCMHHIISDGWSINVLLKEMSLVYASYCNGKPPSLEPLTFQYLGYSVWQRDALTDEKLTDGLRYWKRQLSEYTNLDMPLDYPRPPQFTGKGNSIGFILDTELSSRINAVCQQVRITPFTLFMAGVYTLLRKYSGQQDICIGMPVANRNQRELEDLVGFFVNTLAIRINPEDEEFLTVDKLLKLVHQTIVEGQDNQNVPIEKILDFLKPKRDLSRSPIFQVLINYTPFPIGKIALADCTLQPLIVNAWVSKYDLTFHFNEIEGGKIRFDIEFASDLYHSDTIEEMGIHLEKVLDTLAHHSDRRVSNISLLGEREKHQLLQGCDCTGTNYPKDTCIHKLFEEQVRKTPQNIAVSLGDRTLTYQELNQQANQLAHYLRKQEIHQESLIAICLNRSLEMLIGILGILKAGGAYVPIDPAYPKERILFTLHDANITTVISDQVYRHLFDPSKEILVVVVNEARQTFGEESVENPQLGLAPNNLAYVIYTSGTTGKPKGVMLEHRNVVRLFKTDTPLFDFNERDVWTLFHSICFDFSVWEIYGALFYGGRIAIVPHDIAKDSIAFSTLLVRENVTILNQTPNAFYALLTQLPKLPTDLKIRYVIFGGEALKPSLLNDWYFQYPKCKLINMYGITEMTVHVTYKEIRTDEIESGKSNIGKPIPTLSCYVLDEDNNLLPKGAVGELYVGGAGVARGYLDRPQLTREKFVSNPFDSTMEKLYKTGDMVRYLRNGDLEYLGRIDNQVKIRGFRIELEEIGSVLANHDVIHQAVVVVQNDQNAKQLIAYYVAKESQETSALKTHLQKELPDYMIPTRFIKIDEIPVTSNGKVDRKLLQSQKVNFITEATYAPPSTLIETSLVAIWQEVLNTQEPVGIHNNFFELGGNSLLTIQLVSKMIETFKTEKIRVIDILKNPTINSLAKLVERRLEDHSYSNPYIVPLRESDAANFAPTFVIPGIPGISDGYYDLAQFLPGNRAVYGLQMKGAMGEISAAQSVEEMAEHNIELIESLNPRGKLRLYGHSYGGIVIYEMLRQLNNTDLQVDGVVLIDCSPFLPRDQTNLNQLTKETVHVMCDQTLDYFEIDPIKFYEKVDKVLDAPSEQWLDRIFAILCESEVSIDRHIFLRIMKMIEDATSVKYKLEEKLPYTIHFVIASATLSLLSLADDAWDPYFENVHVIHSSSNHLSIIKKSHCPAWLKELYTFRV